MSTWARRPKSAIKKRANADKTVKIQQDANTNTTRFFVTMVSYLRGRIRQMYRSMLITNKVRNVTPPPMPPNVSDKNQKIQAFDRLVSLYPIFSMKLVCDNNPTKASDNDNEQSKRFFGDCRSEGFHKIADKTSRLEVTAVIEEIPFTMRKKMETSMVYQEMADCASINEQTCSEGSEVGELLGVNTVVSFHNMMMQLALLMSCCLA